MEDADLQWAEVSNLSDDDVVAAPPPPLPQRRRDVRRAASRKLASGELRISLGKTAHSLCSCACYKVGGLRQSCFFPFIADLERLIELRVALDKLHKQDFDDKARVVSNVMLKPTDDEPFLGWKSNRKQFQCSELSCRDMWPLWVVEHVRPIILFQHFRWYNT